MLPVACLPLSHPLPFPTYLPFPTHTPSPLYYPTFAFLYALHVAFPHPLFHSLTFACAFLALCPFSLFILHALYLPWSFLFGLPLLRSFLMPLPHHIR